MRLSAFSAAELSKSEKLRMGAFQYNNLVKKAKVKDEKKRQIRFDPELFDVEQAAELLETGKTHSYEEYCVRILGE
jgi:hypothetical protein